MYFCIKVNDCLDPSVEVWYKETRRELGLQQSKSGANYGKATCMHEMKDDIHGERKGESQELHP